MGAIWLRDLPTVLQGSPHGVLTVPGWENRSRSSGGYESLEGIVVHHTAEGLASDGWPSVNHQCFTDAERPNAPLHVDRKGIIYIMAAGACNTQGKGGPVIGCPVDDGNRRLIGIEQGNNGVGEAYPAALQESILWLVTRLYDHYGRPRGWNRSTVDRVHNHRTYAPGRKCDPTGPSRWTTNNNAGCGGADAWELSLFRGSVAQALAGNPPPPTEGDEDMAWLIRCTNGTPTQNAVTFAWNGVNITVVTAEEVAVGKFVGLYANNAQVLGNWTAAQLQELINNCFGGPAGATIPGFTVPADPAVAARTAALAAETAAKSAAKMASDALSGVSDLAGTCERTETTVTEIKNDVDTLVAGGGSGGGGGLGEADARRVVREELDKTEVPRVPGKLQVSST